VTSVAKPETTFSEIAKIMIKGTALILSAAILSLGLALASTAFADDTMKKDTMSKDSMSSDSMKKDSMSKDSMSKRLLSYLDMAGFHGNDGWVLPIPATFVVRRDGIKSALCRSGFPPPHGNRAPGRRFEGCQLTHQVDQT
jgi:pentapeptide MXKDX repeat protein